MIELDENWRRRLRRNLRAWYDRHARDLPWRRTADPYRIWISEIMLQQTTVAAVVPYFARFVARFPTVEQLAAADETDVLRQWEGLGYYSRARNIHRAARRLMAEYGGVFPQDVDALHALPGIGRYTAGAIASFAFDQRAPIVEANTLRLYSRLLGYRGDPRSADGQRRLWTFAEQILPRQQPGRFNQALMELGATVCTQTRPDCPRCPVRSCCRAFADGAQDEIPRPKVRPEITDVTEAAVAVHRDGRFLLRRRGEGERWAGLWDFPRFAVEDRHAGRMEQWIGQRLLETTGVAATFRRQLTELRHGVTRFRIRLLCVLAEYQSGGTEARDDQAWLSPAEFANYPLSVTGRKLAVLLAGTEDDLPQSRKGAKNRKVRQREFFTGATEIL